MLQDGRPWEPEIAEATRCGSAVRWAQGQSHGVGGIIVQYLSCLYR